MALITADTARQMSAKAVAARQAKRLIERSRLELIDKLLAQAAQPTDKPTIQPESDSYLASRLNRIRKQLDLIDTRIEAEAKKNPCDGQLLNWLCSAQERLAEQERVTAGRPGPGTLKPAQASSASSRQTAPTISAPRPASPQPAAPASQPAPSAPAPPTPVPPHIPKPLDI